MNITNELSTVRLESPAFPADSVQIYEMMGYEAIGKLFEFEIEMLAEVGVEIDQDQLLAEPASLIFSRNGQDSRRIFGIVSSVRSRLHPDGNRLSYSIQFVPRMFALSMNKMSRVFVDMSIPEIVKAKLDDAGFAQGRDYELRLLAQYPKKELVIQYEETDVNFISRLAEHVGISLTFEHREEMDVAVFCDNNMGFRRLDGVPIAFNRLNESVCVFELEQTTRTIPRNYVLRDYNYRTPHVGLMSQSAVSDAGSGAVVEYGAHFSTKDEGDYLARVRTEELRATRQVFEGQSDVQTLEAGLRFSLDGHSMVKEELLIIELHHHASQSVFGIGRGDERPYSNQFRAIPHTTPFRPPRVTEKPRVHGAITGVIEAPQTGQQYADVDDDGRYHVRFMFDPRDTARGRASSLLRMAQPHAGPGYGFHFPLRDGVEVMLTCIDGDPDRPIITGAVPNPLTPSTVGTKNSMRNVIRTGGGTELNIDDNEGATRFKITTPCHNTVFQMGAPNAPVAGILMGTDKDAQLNAGSKIDIIAGDNINESAPWIDVAGGSKIKEHAPEIELYGGAKVFISAPDIVEQAGSKDLTKAPIIELRAGAILNASSGALLNITGVSSVSIQSGDTVSIKAPTINVEGETTVKGETVIVQGNTISVEGGTVNVKGGPVSLKGSSIKLNA